MRGMTGISVFRNWNVDLLQVYDSHEIVRFFFSFLVRPLSPLAAEQSRPVCNKMDMDIKILEMSRKLQAIAQLFTHQDDVDAPFQL